MTLTEVVALSPDALRQIGARWHSELSASERVRVAHLALVHVLNADRTGLLKETISLAEAPDEWDRAADLFDRIRPEVLRHERGGSGASAEAMTLQLAEMTVQLAYNASGPPHPFDDTVVLWLPTTIHALVLTGSPSVDVEGLAALIDLP